MSNPTTALGFPPSRIEKGGEEDSGRCRELVLAQVVEMQPPRPSLC